ncbi:MAG TPA: PP2C family protein-serine/threonine phosphatase [Nocardioidaceae bacterium]
MASPSRTVRVSRNPLARVMRRGGRTARRAIAETETTWLVVLISMSLLFMVAGQVFDMWWPLTAYVIPVVLAMNVLSLARMVVLDIVVGVCLTISIAEFERGLTRPAWAGIGVIVTVMVIVLWFAVDRQTLGVASTRGESMLIDLRDRLASQSQLPALPRAWHAEAVMRSAGGASFAGDFIVAAKSITGDLLEVAVVDVSGKGVGAGSRALLLSGAFGGLLGSLPEEEFLPAANEYLMRQEWSEGFATAVHMSINLKDGTFRVRTAGHPPALQFQAGSGRWVVHWTEGPVLGLIHHADYTTHRGQMMPGDALLLYTDGLVETPKRDISYGIDKLLGEAERLVQQGFVHGASRLVASVESESDDRALFLLHRR